MYTLLTAHLLVDVQETHTNNNDTTGHPLPPKVELISACVLILMRLLSFDEMRRTYGRD